MPQPQQHSLLSPLRNRLLPVLLIGTVAATGAGMVTVTAFAPPLALVGMSVTPPWKSSPSSSLGLSLSSSTSSASASTSTTDIAVPSSTMKSENTSKNKNPPSSLFLTAQLVQACRDVAGGTTPFYVYSLDQLDKAATACLDFPNAFGLTVRYAMKACPNRAILQYMHSRNIHMDASSVYEVLRAIHAGGIPPSHISLSTQELPYYDTTIVSNLIDQGVLFNACSLHQLEWFGQHYGTSTSTSSITRRPSVGIRINPGVGSGGFSDSTTGFSKTNVGGPTSAFGIWHEHLSHVHDLVQHYQLNVERIHTHIGSGSDPMIWQDVAQRSLTFCEAFRETVTTCNLGGGFKVGRNPDRGEVTTDLQAIGQPVAQAFYDYAQRNAGRQLRLEIEPGTYLLALAGALVTTVQDKVSTTASPPPLSSCSTSSSLLMISSRSLPNNSNNTTLLSNENDNDSIHAAVPSGGHVFLKLDAGMTDILRPSLYGAIHPMTLLPAADSGSSEKTTPSPPPVAKDENNDTTPHEEQEEKVVVVGHCCESGDLLTPVSGSPDQIAERTFTTSLGGAPHTMIQIGDTLVMDGAGAYCSGMSSKHYNSFPEAAEIMLDHDQVPHLIRKRQALEQLYQNEVDLTLDQDMDTLFKTTNK